MGFAISTSHIISIGSYEKAKEIFDILYPLRNEPQNVRAISKRSETHKLLVKYDNSFAARLCSTDLVTYHEDGTVTITPYASQSSKLFINAVSPSDLIVESLKGVFFIKAGLAHYRPLKDSITFKPTESGGWEPADPSEVRQEYIAEGNSKKMTEVRKKLNTYFVWAKGFSRMQKGAEHTLALTNPGTQKEEAMRLLLTEPDNPKYFMDVYYYLRAMKPQTRAVAYAVSDCYTQTPIHPVDVNINKSRLAW